MSLAHFEWVWLTFDEFSSLWMSLAHFLWGLDCKWLHGLVNYMYCVIKLMFLHCTYMLVVKLGQNKTFTYLFNSMVTVRWFSAITYRRSLTVLIFTSWGFTLKSSFIIMLIQETWNCKWYWTLEADKNFYWKYQLITSLFQTPHHSWLQTIYQRRSSSLVYICLWGKPLRGHYWVAIRSMSPSLSNQNPNIWKVISADCWIYGWMMHECKYALQACHSI